MPLSLANSVPVGPAFSALNPASDPGAYLLECLRASEIVQDFVIIAWHYPNGHITGAQAARKILGLACVHQLVVAGQEEQQWNVDAIASVQDQPHGRGCLHEHARC